MAKLSTEYGLLASSVTGKLSTEYATDGATPAIPTYANTSYLSVTAAANAGYFETDSLPITFNESFSYSYWIKMSSIYTSYLNAFYANLHDGTYDSYNRLQPIQNQYRGSNQNYFAIGGAFVQYFDPYLDNDVWHNVTVTWSNSNISASTSITSAILVSNLKLYVDGQKQNFLFPVGSATKTGSSVVDKLRIGDCVKNNTEPSFNLSDVAIWKGSELSAAQVLEIYGTGDPHDIRAVANMPVPSRYYLFEDVADPTYEEISQSSAGTVSNGTITLY